MIRVTHPSGENRYDRIVRMIEESERLKSGVETKASRLADRLVPWCLGGSLLTWILTRDTTRAVSVLMVDFSCALKVGLCGGFTTFSTFALETAGLIKDGHIWVAIAYA